MAEAEEYDGEHFCLITITHDHSQLLSAVIISYDKDEESSSAKPNPSDNSKSDQHIENPNSNAGNGQPSESLPCVINHE